MIEVIKKIITHVLTAVYQPFGVSLILTVFIMFTYMFAVEQGWKVVVKKWIENFKKSKTFQRNFFFVFYTVLLLFRTLLNRNMWMNPVSNVIGIWGIYDKNGEITTEIFENFILFIPFIIFLFWACEEKLENQTVRILTILWRSIAITFLFSFSIELLQLFLRLGTFQLSDLFFNTLGGLIGGLLYWIVYKIRFRKKD